MEVEDLAGCKIKKITGQTIEHILKIRKKLE